MTLFNVVTVRMDLHVYSPIADSINNSPTVVIIFQKFTRYTYIPLRFSRMHSCISIASVNNTAIASIARFSMPTVPTYLKV